MSANYTCIACREDIPTGTAIIVGITIDGYPDNLPTNVVACRGCEDRARAMVARELAGREKRDGLE